MAVFHVKKTSLGDDQTSLVFKGKIVEGPISKGMTVEIPVTQEAVVKMKIFDVVLFEKQKDESKKVGLVVDFKDLPDDMEVIMSLNIAEEEALFHLLEGGNLVAGTAGFRIYRAHGQHAANLEVRIDFVAFDNGFG